MKKLTIISSLMLIFIVSATSTAIAARTSLSATKSFRVSATIPEIVGVNVFRQSDIEDEAKLISEKSLKNIEFTILVRNSQRYLVKTVVLR